MNRTEISEGIDMLAIYGKDLFIEYFCLAKSACLMQ